MQHWNLCGLIYIGKGNDYRKFIKKRTQFVEIKRFGLFVPNQTEQCEIFEQSRFFHPTNIVRVIVPFNHIRISVLFHKYDEINDIGN